VKRLTQFITEIQERVTTGPLLDVQSSASFSLFGPANRSPKPAKTKDPHFDALTLYQVTLGLD
jgi:hypothetical protein